MGDDFSDLDNTLINDNYVKNTFNGSKPEIEKFLDKFKVNDDDRGNLMYVEKVLVLRNGEWAYDTYIRANKSISKNMVKRYVNNLEKDYEVVEVSYEFHGGPPMGTTMMDYREIQGENVWVVNLKPKLYEYLKKNGTVGNLEDLYNQIGGNDEIEIEYDHKLHDKYRLIHNKYNLHPSDNGIVRLGKIIGNEAHKINSLIIDTIKNVFFIEDNEERDTSLLNPIKQVNTFFNGHSYYTYINVYKDGKFIDKVQVNSKQNPIEWQLIVNKIFELNKDSKFYGYVYRLTNSFNKGLILETTDDARYKIDYKCKYDN